MVRNKNILFKIEFFVLIIQIYALYDFASKNSSRYNYDVFVIEVEKQIEQKKNKDLEIYYKFYNVFGHYQDTNLGPQLFIIFFINMIHFFNFIFLIIGFYIHKNKTNSNCKNICIPIFLFSLNLLISIFEFYFEFFCECSELGLTKAQLNLFNDYKEQIIKNLNSVKKRISFMKIYSILLIICNIIHIILTIILRKAIKNKNTPVPIPALEKEEKDIEEINEDNSGKGRNFILFDNESNGLFVMKFIKFINKKFGI